MIRTDAMGRHAQTNPSSPDRKRVRARIAPDRTLAAPALRLRSTVCKSMRHNRSSIDERTGGDLNYSTVTSFTRKATEGNESYNLQSFCAANCLAIAATIRARPLHRPAGSPNVYRMEKRHIYDSSSSPTNVITSGYFSMSPHSDQSGFHGKISRYSSASSSVNFSAPGF